MSLLAVHDIHAAYGSSRVLFGISLDVAPGECVCLLGRNGVGKTTTMRAIMGLTPPSAGRIVWKGADIAGWPPHRVARAGIGFVPEDRRIFAELTVRENLDVSAQAAGRAGRWNADAVFALFPKLKELGGRQGGYLSGGEQQMLTIGRTLMGNPELLLLDEPSEGLAPLVVENLQEQIGRLKREGLTILSPSRASISRWRSPIASTCSRKARCASRGRPPSCATTPPCVTSCSLCPPRRSGSKGGSQCRSSTSRS